MKPMGLLLASALLSGCVAASHQARPGSQSAAFLIKTAGRHCPHISDVPAAVPVGPDVSVLPNVRLECSGECSKYATNPIPAGHVHCRTFLTSHTAVGYGAGGWQVAGNSMEYVSLTCRSGEVAGATWETWTVPSGKESVLANRCEPHQCSYTDWFKC